MFPHKRMFFLSSSCFDTAHPSFCSICNPMTDVVDRFRHDTIFAVSHTFRCWHLVYLSGFCHTAHTRHEVDALYQHLLLGSLCFFEQWSHIPHKVLPHSHQL